MKGFRTFGKIGPPRTYSDADREIIVALRRECGSFGSVQRIFQERSGRFVSRDSIRRFVREAGESSPNQRPDVTPIAPKPLTVMERAVYETAERLAGLTAGAGVDGSADGIEPFPVGIVDMTCLYRTLGVMGFSQQGIDAAIKTLKKRSYWNWKEGWSWRGSERDSSEIMVKVASLANAAQKVSSLPSYLRETYDAADLFADGHGYLTVADMLECLGLTLMAYHSRRRKLKALGLWRWRTRKRESGVQRTQADYADSRVSVDEQRAIHQQIKHEIMPAAVLFDPINDEEFMAMPVAAFQFPPPPRPQPDWQKKEQSLEEVCRRYIREWKEQRRRGPLPIQWPKPKPEESADLASSLTPTTFEPVRRGGRMKGCGWGRIIVGKGH